MANHHLRPLNYFSSRPGVSNFSSRQLSGGVIGSHRTPQGPQGKPSNLKRYSRVVKCNRPNVMLFSKNFIPQNTGDLRVILNLKKINVFIPDQHFRMETLNVILPNLRAHDWAVSIDLKDAYLHVPVHPQSRRLLGFKFRDKTYLYKVLPFDLKDSPWVFSRVVSTVVAHFRLQGIRIFYHLDEWLLVAESQTLLLSHLQATLQFSQSLGFIVNWKKSVLTPQRLPVYLGASLDIPMLIVRPVERRVVALQSLIQELIASPVAPPLLWQKFLGHLASFVDLVPNCRLLMWPLQLHFLRFFSPLSDSQSKLIPLSQKSRTCVQLGRLRFVFWKGILSFSPPPSFFSSDLRCLPVRLGCDSPTSSGFRHLVQGGVLVPYQFSRAQGSFSGSQVSRSSCQRLVPSCSFGQYDSRIVYQLPGRNSLPFSLFSDDRAVGVVSSEGYPSLGRSHSRGGQLGSRLPIHREVSPIRMDSESFDISEDL